jgi:hypothetical protein
MFRLTAQLRQSNFFRFLRRAGGAKSTNANRADQQRVR